MYSTLMTAGIVAIVWLGGERVIAGALSVGAFVAYLELFGRFVGRSYRIPQLVNSVQSGAAAYARLEPLLAPPLGVQHQPAYASFLPNHLPGATAVVESVLGWRHTSVAVAIRSATFRYPDAAQPASEEMNLDTPAGAFIALTGPVGSGKSALARCVAGLYPLDSGEILVNGTRACVASPGLVGYAPQEGYLFSESLRDDVSLGAPSQEDLGRNADATRTPRRGCFQRDDSCSGRINEHVNDRAERASRGPIYNGSALELCEWHRVARRSVRHQHRVTPAFAATRSSRRACSKSRALRDPRVGFEGPILDRWSRRQAQPRPDVEAPPRNPGPARRSRFLAGQPPMRPRSWYAPVQRPAPDRARRPLRDPRPAGIRRSDLQAPVHPRLAERASISKSRTCCSPTAHKRPNKARS